jgi:hypothetical protein
VGWRQLSLRQKIGQTVVLSSDLEAETRAGGGSLRAFFEKYPAGGVFLGAWKLEHLDPQDFRDQHLVTTVNSLSLPEWRRTCGRVFQGLIEAGVASVMVGHLTLPAYQKERLEGRLLPATLPARSSPICSRASWASRGW